MQEDNYTPLEGQLNFMDFLEEFNKKYEVEKMREIKEIKKDILNVKNSIDPLAWDKLTTLLDEIFLAYMIKAKERDVKTLIDNIGHYERHHKEHSQAISDFRDMVENENSSEAKMVYKLKEMFREEF